jgi:hypothetical protein
VQSGNTTVVVPQDSLKFDLTVSNWPFQNTANSLMVGMKLKPFGAKNSNAVIQDSGTNTNTKSINYGNMFFETPTTALYDGVDGNVVVSQTGLGSSTVMNWKFKSFTTSVVYDPVMGGDLTINGVNKMLPTVFLFAVVLFAALFNF